MTQLSLIEDNRAESLDTISEVDEFPSLNKVSHGDLLSLCLKTDTTSLTHGLHRFPAKYIPQVPSWAINQFCDSGSIVLDPFMGSGTTLVEGLCRVKKTYGLDIDPLAKLITQSKINGYDVEKIKALASELISHKGSSIERTDFPMKGVKNPEHWFSFENKGFINSIFHQISMLQCTSKERDLFYCVFSSIIRWVSNADDQSQKTYVSGTLKKNPPNAWVIFEKHLTKAIERITQLQVKRLKGAEAEILDGNALSIPMENESIDLIVTSPPYVDSVDYMYNFMLEYFWLGPQLGVDDRESYNLRRRGAVGSKNPKDKKAILPDPIRCMVEPEQIPSYRRFAVINYFHSMHEHFQEASRVLRKGGRYVLVVGNSQSANGIMPVHDCLTKLAADAGLIIEKAFAYRIRRHYMKFPRKGRGGIILMDWVITLRKTTDKVSLTSPLPIPNIKIGNDEVAN